MAQPRWQLLAETLRADLSALPPGSPVPNETDLAKTYGAAKMTVAQAVQHLASQGLVRRVKGHGTVTRDTRPITLDSTRHVAAARGAKAGGPWSVAVTNAGMTPTVKATKVEHLLQAPQHVAEVIGAEVVRRERLMSADGQPAALTMAWLPWRVAEGNQLSENPNTIPEGIYIALKQAGYLVARATETVGSRLATDDECRALVLPKGAPVLAVQRISYDKAGIPLELLETVADATRVSIQHSIDL